MTDGQQTADATQSPIPRTSVVRNKFFWLSLMLAVALVITSLSTDVALGPVLGVLTVLMLVAFMVRGKAMYWCVAAVCGFGIVQSWYAENSYLDCYEPAAMAKMELHSIQVAIERYAVDHHTYPLEFSSVVEEEYLPELPRNEYRRYPKTDEEKAMSPDEWEQYSRMQPLGSVVPQSSSANACYYRESLGNFAYLPHLEVSEEGTLTAKSYDLCVFYTAPGQFKDEFKRTQVLWLCGY